MNKSIFFLLVFLNASSIPKEKVSTSKTDQPNILFIMADDLNDFVGVMDTYSMVQTPNLDKLASQATIFSNPHSNAPVCAPSRASLFSGIYPHHSVKYGFGNWRKNEVLSNSKTIMEQLRDHGYATAGVGKLMHNPWKPAWDEYGLKQDYTPIAFSGTKKVGHPSVPDPYRNLDPLDASFARLSDVPVIEADGEVPGHSGWDSFPYHKTFHYVKEQERDRLPDERTADWAIDKLEQWEKGNLKKTFFLGVGFIRPHTPLVVPDYYFNKFPIDKIILPLHLNGDEEYCHFEKNYLPGKSKGRKHFDALMASFENEEVALKTYLQAYHASIAFMDDQVGSVLQKLEETSFIENTIVVFTSYHGYTLGEQRNLFKNNLWESSTRIPLIIKDLKRRNQQWSDEAVSLIDLYPTFCDFAKIPGHNRKNEKGRALDGKSLVPLINGENTNERSALSVVMQGDANKLHFSLRTQSWRYIQYANGKEELYNHQVDFFEQKNVIEKREYLIVKKRI